MFFILLWFLLFINELLFEPTGSRPSRLPVSCLTMTPRFENKEPRQTFRNPLQDFNRQGEFFFKYFLLPLYSGEEVWEGIWNQTYLVVLNFCLKRLHHVTIPHVTFESGLISLSIRDGLTKWKPGFSSSNKKFFAKPQIFYVKWHNFFVEWQKKIEQNRAIVYQKLLNYFLFNNFQKLLFSFKLLF